MYEQATRIIGSEHAAVLRREAEQHRLAGSVRRTGTPAGASGTAGSRRVGLGRIPFEALIRLAGRRHRALG